MTTENLQKLPNNLRESLIMNLIKILNIAKTKELDKHNCEDILGVQISIKVFLMKFNIYLFRTKIHLIIKIISVIIYNL